MRGFFLSFSRSFARGKFAAMLDLKEALDHLDTGQWCALVYVSYDEKRGRAGEIIRMNRCRVLTGNPEHATPGAARTGSNALPPSSERRNPEHNAHFTRNVKLANGKIRKLHIRILFAVNGKQVL